MLLNDFLEKDGNWICSDVTSKKLVIINDKSWEFNEISSGLKDKINFIIDCINKEKVDYVIGLLNNDIQENPDNLQYLELGDEELIGKFAKTYLSNLWPVNIFYKWNTFPSIEHWYMYHKFDFEKVISYFKENPEQFEKIKETFWDKDFLSKSFQDLGLRDDFLIDNIEKLYFDKRTRGGFIKKLSIEFEKLWLRNDDWENVKLETMVWLLIEKFSIKEFRSKLLLTKWKKLVEWNDWWDIYWWIDINSNEWINILWRILMILRDKIL